MGHPGDLARAWFGDPTEAAHLLDVSWPVAEEIVSEERSVTHKSGVRALEKLREMGAPDLVIESVERRLMPPPVRPRGIITHGLHGPEMAEQRKRTRESLRHGKPKAYQALQDSGLTLKQLRERAGVGKETVRKALYRDGVGLRSARAIAGVIGEGLSEREICALVEELRGLPQENS